MPYSHDEAILNNFRSVDYSALRQNGESLGGLLAEGSFITGIERASQFDDLAVYSGAMLLQNFCGLNSEAALTQARDDLLKTHDLRRVLLANEPAFVAQSDDEQLVAFVSYPNTPPVDMRVVVKDSQKNLASMSFMSICLNPNSLVGRMLRANVWLRRGSPADNIPPSVYQNTHRPSPVQNQLASYQISGIDSLKRQMIIRPSASRMTLSQLRAFA